MRSLLLYFSRLMASVLIDRLTSMLATLEEQNQKIVEQQSQIEDLTSAVNDINALVVEAEVSLATRAFRACRSGKALLGLGQQCLASCSLCAHLFLSITYRRPLAGAHASAALTKVFGRRG